MNMDVLSEYCFINMGQSPASETYNDDKIGLPFYQGNTDFGEIHPKTRIWCSKPVKIANKGDLLISVRAPIGALNIATEKCCIGRGLAALTPKLEKCKRKYIYFAVQSQIDFLIASGTGSTFKAVNKNTLENLLIPVYSLDKQDKIVEILEKVNNIINKRKAQLLLLDKIVKSRFIEMFGDSDQNTNNFPIIKLGDLCNVGSSKRIYQNEQSITGIPFLRISDLSARIDKGIDTSTLFISNEKYTELYEQGLVPLTGDILVTSRGTLGKCYIIKETDKFYFQDGMISWLSNINKKITNLYLSYLFSTVGIQKQIVNLQAGSTVAYLSISMLKNLNIMTPPIELQNQFATFVEQTNKSKLEIQKSLDKLEILKKSLMQQYFG